MTWVRNCANCPLYFVRYREVILTVIYLVDSKSGDSGRCGKGAVKSAWNRATYNFYFIKKGATMQYILTQEELDQIALDQQQVTND